MSVEKKKSVNEILCCIYFDQVFGPNILYSSVPLSSEQGHPDLGKVLEFVDDVDKSFVFAFRKYQTVNHIFNIDSKFCRGGKELLMISYLIRAAYFRHEIEDIFKYLHSKDPSLKDFAKELKGLVELPEIFNEARIQKRFRNILNLGSEKAKMKFLNLFERYYNLISSKFSALLDLKSNGQAQKVFIFGSPNSGKCTFIQNAEVVQFHRSKSNDFLAKMFDLFLENIEVLKYECFKQNFNCKECTENRDCLENIHGLITMVNINDKSSILEGKDLLDKIIQNYSDNKRKFPPLLIIGNKFQDEDFISDENIKKTYNFEDLKRKGIKANYFPIDITKEDDKILDSLRWLLKKMI